MQDSVTQRASVGEAFKNGSKNVNMVGKRQDHTKAVHSETISIINHNDSHQLGEKTERSLKHLRRDMQYYLHHAFTISDWGFSGKNFL